MATSRRVIATVNHTYARQGIRPHESTRLRLGIRAGRLIPLAVTGSMRLEVLPDVPVMSDFVPGYEAGSWFGICAPKNPPADITDRLNEAINAGLTDPKIKARLADLGATGMYSSPTGFGAFINAETEKYAEVIWAAGIKRR